MNYLRLGIGWALSAALIAAGIRGAVLTYEAWIPCAGDHFTEACLKTMDSPGHISALANLWLLSLTLGVVAGFVLRSRPARLLGFSAAGLVLLMNGGSDYAIYLAAAGGHHDFPPGTGYAMVVAFILAGVLVGMGALIETRRSDPAAHADDTTVSTTAAQASA